MMDPAALMTLPLAFYLAAFLTPFVQEDAAVIGTASAMAAGHGDPVLLAAAWTGLMVSDGWKYWAGRLANRFSWAARFAAHPRIGAVRDTVLRRLGLALVTARFTPGTRIPLYLAAGVFEAPFVRFFLMIGFTGALYLGLSWALFEVLGEIVGEKVRAWLPAIVVPVIVLVLLAGWGWPKLRARLQARRA